MVEKSKNKRLEEKEKLEAELDRSLAVAKVKEAHKQIEDTEKSRKRSAVLSICMRIDFFNATTLRMLDVLLDHRDERSKIGIDVISSTVSSTLISSMEASEQTYASICYDFRKSLDIGDEAMEKMFPPMKFRRDILGNAIDDLLNVYLRMLQMKSYCERFLL